MEAPQYQCNVAPVLRYASRVTVTKQHHLRHHSHNKASRTDAVDPLQICGVLRKVYGCFTLRSHLRELLAREVHKMASTAGLLVRPYDISSGRLMHDAHDIMNCVDRGLGLPNSMTKNPKVLLAGYRLLAATGEEGGLAALLLTLLQPPVGTRARDTRVTTALRHRHVQIVVHAVEQICTNICIPRPALDDTEAISTRRGVFVWCNLPTSGFFSCFANSEFVGTSNTRLRKWHRVPGANRRPGIFGR